MEFEPWHAIAGWLTVKIVEWTANSKRSVLTDTEKERINSVLNYAHDNREMLTEILRAQREITITQRETAILLKQIAYELRRLEKDK